MNEYEIAAGEKETLKIDLQLILLPSHWREVIGQAFCTAPKETGRDGKAPHRREIADIPVQERSLLYEMAVVALIYLKYG